MSVVDEFYVVQVNKIGRPLYANKGYRFYQSTSKDIYSAYKFQTLEEAQKCAQYVKFGGGRILKFKLVDVTGNDDDTDETRTEIENLRATVDELKRQRDEAREQLEIFKDGRKKAAG